ncbi:glycerol-3-phosphate 1-O-acyltransferase PlsY [Gudongella sp. SC589]|jgi:glycerol-3-phosphate acyltransferase PlsY|uniref:glycerol-3-phosphate 1-O-acyltransferase PlsY n=1 Tax=Gudongella sp. SC589 TaxID=3385990 RepID=UPI003904BAE3
MEIFLIPVLSYLIGSFSSAYVVGRLFKKIDIRNHGSGNAGATNALRIMGKKLGVLTFLMDFAKGIIAVLIGLGLGGYSGGMSAALFAVLGHNWPIFFKFKGGKGIATTIAALAMLQFPITLISVIAGVVTAAISRYVSLGSLVFLTVLFALTFTGMSDGGAITSIITFILMILGYYRHKGNIKRLIKGNENKIGR